MFYRIKILLIFFIIINSCTNVQTDEKYYSNGNLKLRIEFSDNYKDRKVKSYDSTGSLISEYELKNDQYNGEYKFFYKNQNLKEHGYYRNGKLNGDYNIFYLNSNLKEKGSYLNGNRFGWRFYYDSSNILTKKVEYIIHNENSYTNQTIKYEMKGKINYTQSCFYELIKNKTFVEIKVVPEKDFNKTRLVIGCFENGYNEFGSNIIYNEISDNFSFNVPDSIIHNLENCSEVIIDNYKEVNVNEELLWETRRLYVSIKKLDSVMTN